jgi:hypothetical protein
LEGRGQRDAIDRQSFLTEGVALFEVELVVMRLLIAFAAIFAVDAFC